MEKRTADIFTNRNLPNDFVVREKGATVGLYVLFMVLLLAVGIAGIIINDRVLLMVQLIVLLVLLCAFILSSANKTKKILSMTQFKSALFSSALGMKHDFVMIIDVVNNKVFYFSYSFQAMFPSFVSQDDLSVSSFLQYAGISNDDALSINKLIEQGQDGKIIADMEVVGQKKSIELLIEPIPRPYGFVLIRGKVTI